MQSSGLFGLYTRNKRVVALFVVIIIFSVVFLVFSPHGGGLIGSSGDTSVRGDLRRPASSNCRYQYQQVFTKYTESSNSYSIAIISDMDTKSKVGEEKKWRSILKKGILTRDPDTGKFSVNWTSEKELHSALNEAGRAMELSDLTYYNKKLLAFDDRTGVAFRVEEDQVIPYRILMDGNGDSTKGMKVEWATVKDDLLYIGSTGKEWTTQSGDFLNNNPLWIKTLDVDGKVSNVDWYDVYTKLRKETGTLFPGYLLHEAVRWRASDRRWFFFPRRSSTLPYNDKDDEERGANVVISLDENFGDIQVTRLGPLIPTHGFSAFQFLPWREHEVVALKTEEYNDSIATYITVFDTNDGSILMPEELVGNVKFEGLEII